MKCLAHPAVIAGHAQPCAVCAPQLPAVQAMIQEHKDQGLLDTSRPQIPLITRKRPPTEV